MSDTDESESEKKKSDYQKAPEVPEEMAALYEAVRAVLAKEVSVSEAAQKVGLSRNRFQTLMHRGLSGLLEGLAPRPQGRKAKPQREAELEEELRRLQRENARLSERVETVDRLLGVASDLMRGRVTLSGRQTGASATTEKPTRDDEEPDGEARRRLDGVGRLKQLGLNAGLAAALLGKGASTVRRHAQRARRGEAMVRKPGPPRRRDAQTHAAAEQLVRELRGDIGAEALSRSVAGLSRRMAARVKQHTLTTLERERVSACQRVRVTAPGLIRGFDAMHVGAHLVLVAADARVAYRTTLMLCAKYDERAVLDALELDAALNGVPLVYRLDRASCQRTRAVRDWCAAHGVLMLHGPPRHPQYYGQLERQNREHQQWLTECRELDVVGLTAELSEMKYALNCVKRRRSLQWRTADEVWRARPDVKVDRAELADEVRDRAARIQRQLEARGASVGQVERYAIEAALKQRGWLAIENGVGAK